MSMTQLPRDSPENYMFNKNKYIEENSKEVISIKVNIDNYVYELMQCGSDRKKFNEIMNSLEKKFLDGENLSSDDENIDIKISRNDYTNRGDGPFLNQEYKNSNFSQHKNNFGKNSPEKQNYLSSSNNIKKSGIFQENTLKYNFPNYVHNSKFNKNYIQKKYTDVHANTKFYYPDNYNEDPDDLNLDKSQWTDRANTSTIYNRQNTNLSYVSNSNSISSNYNDKNNMYPDKLNAYFISNKMKENLKPNREILYSKSDTNYIGSRNFYSEKP